MKIPKAFSPDRSFFFFFLSLFYVNYDLFRMNSSPLPLSHIPVVPVCHTPALSLCFLHYTHCHIPNQLTRHYTSFLSKLTQWTSTLYAMSTLYSCLFLAVWLRSTSTYIFLLKLISLVKCRPKRDSNTQLYGMSVMLFFEESVSCEFYFKAFNFCLWFCSICLSFYLSDFMRFLPYLLLSVCI